MHIADTQYRLFEQKISFFFEKQSLGLWSLWETDFNTKGYIEEGGAVLNSSYASCKAKWLKHHTGRCLKAPFKGFKHWGQVNRMGGSSLTYRPFLAKVPSVGLGSEQWSLQNLKVVRGPGDGSDQLSTKKICSMICPWPCLSSHGGQARDRTGWLWG